MAQSTANTHFFDKEAFESMKDTAFFINVGRGGAVDEEALADALDAGKIAGVGLDVLENEDPNLEQCRLTNRENVILTPHAAFYSNDSLLALQKLSCMNLIYYVKGEYEKVSWIVNGDILGKISKK